MTFQGLVRPKIMARKKAVTEPTQPFLPYPQDEPTETGRQPAPSAPTSSLLHNPPLCQASAQVARASFAVVALSGLIDMLGNADAPLQKALWHSVALACDDLIRARKTLHAVRALTHASCPYCGASAPASPSR
jgi:hypothetical protein